MSVRKLISHLRVGGHITELFPKSRHDIHRKHRMAIMRPTRRTTKYAGDPAPRMHGITLDAQVHRITGLHQVSTSTHLGLAGTAGITNLRTETRFRRRMSNVRRGDGPRHLNGTSRVRRTE